MRILVTGSSGFIGRRVMADLAAAGHEPAGFDLRPPDDGAGEWRHYGGDLMDADRLSCVMRESAPEVVVHLAAKTGLKKVPADSLHFAANTVGTRNLMAAIGESRSVRRVVYVSTKYVYRGAPPTPHRQYRPNTSYGESKVAMEEMIWEAGGAAPEWCIARPTTIWGAGMSPHYQRFLGMLKRGSYVHFGDGRALKHLGYVDNTAFQLRRLAEAGVPEVDRKVFYVGDYDAWRVGDWAEAFRCELGGPPIRRVPLWLARAAARCGDGLVNCGWRKFPLTSFRFANLTENDLCEMEPTRAVCGEVPIPPDEAVRRTAKWFLAEAAANKG